MCIKCMTLKFELGRDLCTIHLTTNFHRPMFNRSKVIMLTNKQTYPQRDFVENIHSAPLYATLVEKDHCAVNC